MAGEEGAAADPGEADDLEGALDMAKACPFLEMGTLEVAEVMEMK